MLSGLDVRVGLTIMLVILGWTRGRDSAGVSFISCEAEHKYGLPSKPWVFVMVRI